MDHGMVLSDQSTRNTNYHPSKTLDEGPEYRTHSDDHRVRFLSDGIGDSGIFADDAMDAEEELKCQGYVYEGLAEETNDEMGEETEESDFQNPTLQQGYSTKLSELQLNSKDSPGKPDCVSESSQQEYQYPGPASPASCQGSEGSIEFLDRTVAGIQRKVETVQTAQSQLWTSSVPLRVHKLLEKAIRNRAQFKFLMNAFRQSIMTMAYATNECQLDSAEADDLEASLEELDTKMLSAVAGHYLMSSTPMSNSPRPEISQMHQNLSGKRKAPTPNSIKLKMNARVRQRQSCNKSISVRDEVWEKAYFAFETNDTDNRRIEKVGQVFFKAVMTTEEIKVRSISGRNMAGKFDDGKMSWIKAACAYVWTRPAKNRRNTNSFELEWGASSLELDAEMWRTLKMRVFTNYASRERKKILVAEKAENDNAKPQDT